MQILSRGKLIPSIFGMYLEEMQEKIVETWRISPEVVKENEGIANFKASRTQHMDTSKERPQEEWLKM
jgi:hypothetical protein